MFRVLIFLILVPISAFGQYEDYESYDTFEDLDKYQRDYGLIFSPSIIATYVDEQNQVNGGTVSDRERNLLFYDLRFGYIFRGGFYFGMLYSGETVDINDGVPKNSRTSFGMSIGYIRKGLSLGAHYFPYSKQTLDGTTDVEEYSEGMGFQLDVAYYFRLGRFVSIGPQLVYKSISYGEGESATTNVDADASSQHTVVTPMFTILINLYRG